MRGAKRGAPVAVAVAVAVAAAQRGGCQMPVACARVVAVMR